MQTRFTFAFLAICLIFSIHTVPSQAISPTSSEWVMEKTGIQVQKSANDVKQLAAGGATSCQITDEGAVQCWGQLAGGVEKSNVPKTVEGLSEGVTAISLGNKYSSYACALLKNGRLKCWGNNSSGQLGDGTLQSRSMPQNVLALDEIVTAISTGMDHACALLITGGVKCWGSNYYGQLGQKNISLSALPIEVTGLKEGVKAIAVGGGHNCALLQSGQIKCWGSNYYGQLGNGTISKHVSDPVVVGGVAGEVKSLISGSDHTCIVLKNGQMQCWGLNDLRQAGIALNSSGSPYGLLTPTLVQHLPGKVMFAKAGVAHSCAVIEDGSVYCWGTNYYGQLGIGKINQTLGSPKPVALPYAVTDLALGSNHTCALLADKTVWCWGDNDNGQASENLNPSHASATLPSAAKSIASSELHTCVIVQQDDVYCWLESRGYASNDEINNADYATKISALPNSIQAISVGINFTCAAPKSGGVLCWGTNTEGQLGNQKQLSSTLPIAVNGINENVIALTSGRYHTCALTEDGKVKCWGANFTGQVAADRLTKIYTATQVAPLPEIKQITTSDNFSCALSVSGAVYCWGGTLATTSGNGVVQIPNLSEGGITLGSSNYKMCVLLTDGSIKCWQIKSRGETEDANATQFTTPKQESWLKEPAIKMSVGFINLCVQTNTRMICDNDYSFQDRIKGFDGDELGIVSGNCLLTKQGAIWGCGNLVSYYYDDRIYLPQKVSLQSNYPFKLFVPQLLIKRIQTGE